MIFLRSLFLFFSLSSSVAGRIVKKIDVTRKTQNDLLCLLPVFLLLFVRLVAFLVHSQFFSLSRYFPSGLRRTSVCRHQFVLISSIFVLLLGDSSLSGSLLPFNFVIFSRRIFSILCGSAYFTAAITVLLILWGNLSKSL